MTPEEIVQRFSQLEARRRVVEQQWDDIRELVVPYRGDMFRDEYANETSVDWRENRNVYDSTAILACQELASSVHGSLTSPSTKWFGLRFREDKLNSDSKAKEWLEGVTDKVYQTLQESNFNLQAAEMYLDLCSFGTSCVVEEVVDEADWKGVEFRAIPIKECFFEEDYKGGVKTLYRRLRWTPIQIETKFGDKIPQVVKDQLQSGSAVETRHEVIFCIYQREGKEDMDVSKPIAEKARPFGFKYVFRQNNEMMGEEGGYYEMPAFVARWKTTSGSQWGNSPAMECLPDIKGLNILAETIQEATERNVDPPILISERNYFGTAELTSGTQNVVKDVDGVKAFSSESDYPMADNERQRLVQAIRQAFHVDQLELKESPAMTATEVTVRYDLMQRTMATPVARLQSDALNPTVMRTVNILHRAGQLDPMPDVVQQEQGTLDIEYVGPMVRSQKAEAVLTIQRYVEFQVMNAEISGGESLDILNWDAVGREMAEALGVPAAIVNTRAETAQAEEDRKQRMAQATELANTEQAGKALTAVGEGMAAMEGGMNPGGQQVQ